jgi:dTDP-4-dehydrorhamnose reductase
VKILVTGSNGLIGHAVVRAASSRDLEVEALPRERCDLCQRSSVLSRIREYAPDVVVHAAANLDAAACEQNPEQAQIDNVITTHNVALACATTDSAMAYLSANVVFDGQAPYPYRYFEYDAPNPQSVYAKTKYAGELCAKILLNRLYIIRTSWVFGRRPSPGRIDFVQHVLKQASAAAKISMVTDLWANPTYVRDLAEAVVTMIQTDAYGTYHLVNEDATSPFDFAKEILRSADRDAEVNPAKLADVKGPVPPAPNTGLRNVVAAGNLGIALRPLKSALREYILELREER